MYHFVPYAECVTRTKSSPSLNRAGEAGEGKRGKVPIHNKPFSRPFGIVRLPSFPAAFDWFDVFIIYAEQIKVVPHRALGELDHPFCGILG